MCSIYRYSCTSQHDMAYCAEHMLMDRCNRARNQGAVSAQAVPVHALTSYQIENE